MFLDGAQREAFVVKVENHLSAVRSFTATFQQEKKLAIFKDVVHSNGVLAFQAPDLIRWEIREPFRSILIVAGNSVGKFEFMGAQRRALQLGRGSDLVLVVMERIRQLFVGRFDRNEYVIEAAELPAPTVRLTPKGGRLTQLLHIELRFTPSLDGVETVTISERAGDSTVMRFKQVARDQSFVQGTFSSTDPIELDARGVASQPATKPSK